MAAPAVKHARSALARRSTSTTTKAGGKASAERGAGPASKAGLEGRPRISRSAERVYVNGIPASTLVGKYPSVQVQPAPAAPRHFTRDEISAAVARRMKLV